MHVCVAVYPTLKGLGVQKSGLSVYSTIPTWEFLRILFRYVGDKQGDEGGRARRNCRMKETFSFRHVCFSSDVNMFAGRIDRSPERRFCITPGHVRS